MKHIAQGGGIYIRHGLMIVGKPSNPAKGPGKGRQTSEAAGAVKEAAASDCSKTSTALVAQSEASRWSPPARVNRPNASFVLQLIATAEQIPQTRILRRAAVADAMLYYNTATKPASENVATSKRLSRIV